MYWFSGPGDRPRSGDYGHLRREREAADYSFDMVYQLHRAEMDRDAGELVNEFDIRPEWLRPPQAKMVELYDCFSELIFDFAPDGGGISIDEIKAALARFDDRQFTLTDLGQFPAHAQIFSQYLKGRAYSIALYRLLEHMLDGSEYGDREPDKVIADIELVRSWWKKAVNMFSRFINESTAYSGGRTILALPIGLGYFHLWDLLRLDQSLVQACDKKWLTSEWEISAASELGAEDQEYALKRARFLDQAHCRAQALIHLYRHRERHGRGVAYYDFAESMHYLSDDFADPYFQAHWAIEYATLPAVNYAISQLKEGE